MWGHRLLQWLTQWSLSSGTYYIVSGVLIAVSIVPWCACMGATIPLAMFSIRSDQLFETRRSFSFLYLSNVVGAALGAFVPLFLIEERGFRETLRTGALLNLAIALVAWTKTLLSRHRLSRPTLSTAESAPKLNGPSGRNLLILLFMSGLTTMGMEVIWIRLFTAYLGPLVYNRFGCSFRCLELCHYFWPIPGCHSYRFFVPSLELLILQPQWII